MEHSVVASALLDGRALFVGGLHVVIAGTVTSHVLLTKRDVPAAIGWIGLAWLSPVLGALLYVGFGINRVRRRAHRLMGSVPSVDRPITGDISSDDPLKRLKVAIGKITGQDLATGKVVAALHCGDQAYPQMLAAIESAKYHVRLSTYIFRTDEVGLQFIGVVGQSPSQRSENPRPDWWLRRRIFALLRLSPPAQAGRSRFPLPPFDSAVEDAVSRPAVA